MRGRGDFAGILPLYHSTSPLTGSHLSSLRQGVLAENRQTVAALLDHARSWRDSIGAKYLELRGGPLDHPGDQAFTIIRTFINTDRPPEILWSRDKKENTPSDTAGGKGSNSYRMRCHSCRNGRLLLDLRGAYAKVWYPRNRYRLFPRDSCATWEGSAAAILVKDDRRLIGGILCILNSRSWSAFYGVVRPSRRDKFCQLFVVLACDTGCIDLWNPMLDLGRSAPDSNVTPVQAKMGREGN